MGSKFLSFHAAIGYTSDPGGGVSMRQRLRFLCVLLAFACSLASRPACAQTGQNFGELVGSVVDDHGGVLPGVTVTLKGPALMGTSTAVTNDRGMYRFPAVPSGTYTLTFDLSGFSRLARADIVVPVRQ